MKNDRREQTNEVVQLANGLNTDYTGHIKDTQCLSCKHGCISFEFILNGECNNYEHRISLKEIKDEIREQNINIRKLCKDNNLKYWVMMDMLRNKLALSFRYYSALEDRIFEKDEYIKYHREVF